MAKKPPKRQFHTLKKKEQAPNPAIMQEAKRLCNSGMLSDAARLLAPLTNEFPQNAELHFLLGSVYAALKQHPQALQHLNRSLSLNPNNGAVYTNIGIAYEAMNKMPEAAAAFQKAVSINPNDTLAWRSIGVAFKKRHLAEKAIYAFERCISINAQDYTSMVELAPLYTIYGEDKKAKMLYQMLYQATNDVAHRVNGDMIIPVIHDSMETIDAVRQQFIDALDRNIQLGGRILEPQRFIRRQSFWLSYHGKKNREILEKQADMFRKLCPQLTFTATHCIGYAPLATGKIKVGYVTRYLHDHAMSRCFNEYIKAIAEQDNLEVYILFTESQYAVKDAKYEDIAQVFDGQIVQIPDSISEAQSIIAALKLDILIYSEIGMDAMAYFLAFARLAPLQCVLPGHPETSGLTTVDYFVSSEIIESPEAADFYTEKLLLLSDTPNSNEKTAIPATLKPRTALGLPEHGHLYMCPMKLHKIHPDFDNALNKILKADSEAIIIFFKDSGKLTEQLEARLARHVDAKNMPRIQFAPWAAIDDFTHCLLHADVLIDPFHFGGGSTNYIALALGVPIVTMPNPFLTSRNALACYVRIGTMELVTNNEEDYVKLAVRVANDKAYRKQLSDFILKHNDTMFKGAATAKEMMEKLTAILQKAS